MNDFIKHFRRASDGAWLCFSNCEWDGPKGRVQVALGSRFMPGTSFMGIDLAKLLDEQCEKNKPVT